MKKKLSHAAVAAAILLQCGAPSLALAGPSVCLQTMDIDRTEVLPGDNPRIILFYTRDHKVWQNKLLGSCATLGPDDGFAYETSINEICSNLQTIRVLQTGEVCELGEFTPYTPAKPAM